MDPLGFHKGNLWDYKKGPIGIPRFSKKGIIGTPKDSTKEPQGPLGVQERNPRDP